MLLPIAQAESSRWIVFLPLLLGAIFCLLVGWFTIERGGSPEDALRPHESTHREHGRGVIAFGAFLLALYVGC